MIRYRIESFKVLICGILIYLARFVNIYGSNCLNQSNVLCLAFHKERNQLMEISIHLIFRLKYNCKTSTSYLLQNLLGEPNQPIRYNVFSSNLRFLPLRQDIIQRKLDYTSFTLLLLLRDFYFTQGDQYYFFVFNSLSNFLFHHSEFFFTAYKYTVCMDLIFYN
jgi:hypothetical protein